MEDLIAQYRDQVKVLKRALRHDDILHLYDPRKHDDVWLVRFLLSHDGDTDRALAAARTCLIYRRQFDLDKTDIRAVAPQCRFVDEANRVFLNKLVWHKGNQSGTCNATTHTHTTSSSSQEGILDGSSSRSYEKDDHRGRTVRDHAVAIADDALTMVLPDLDRGGIFFYFCLAGIDLQALSNVHQKDWVAAMSYVNEYQFQWNDYLTRTSGRLTKAVHLIDAQGIGVADFYTSTAQQKYTTATTCLEDCYPQAVEAYLVCHAPVWVETPWRLLKPLLPTRVVQKLDFLNPTQYPQDRERLLQYTPDKLLPQRFGGQYERWPLAY